jgi:hypothetical protein
MRYHESKKILKARKGIVSTKSWRKKGFQNGKEASVMVLKREDNDEKRGGLLHHKRILSFP